MPFYVKILLSVIVIVAASRIGRYFPSLSGLLAAMPLTGTIVMVILYTETSGDPQKMEGYTGGTLWGSLLSILFFITARICFRKGLSLTLTLLISFGIWLAGAVINQMFL